MTTAAAMTEAEPWRRRLERLQTRALLEAAPETLVCQADVAEVLGTRSESCPVPAIAAQYGPRRVAPWWAWLDAWRDEHGITTESDDDGRGPEAARGSRSANAGRADGVVLAGQGTRRRAPNGVDGVGDGTGGADSGRCRVRVPSGRGRARRG